MNKCQFHSIKFRMYCKKKSIVLLSLGCGSVIPICGVIRKKADNARRSFFVMKADIKPTFWWAINKTQQILSKKFDESLVITVNKGIYI